MSIRSTEPVVSEAETKLREVEIDLRTVLLYLVFKGGSFGVMKKEVPGKLKYYGYNEKEEIIVSHEEIDAAIEELKKDGLVIEVMKQSGTCKIMDTFLSLAEGVALVAKPAA